MDRPIPENHADSGNPGRKQTTKVYDLRSLENVNQLLKALIYKTKSAYCLSNSLSELKIDKRSSGDEGFQVSVGLNSPADMSLTQELKESEAPDPSAVYKNMTFEQESLLYQKLNSCFNGNSRSEDRLSR